LKRLAWSHYRHPVQLPENLHQPFAAAVAALNYLIVPVQLSSGMSLPVAAWAVDDSTEPDMGPSNRLLEQ
jgi:hypothetical protein